MVQHAPKKIKTEILAIRLFVFLATIALIGCGSVSSLDVPAVKSPELGGNVASFVFDEIVNAELSSSKTIDFGTVPLRGRPVGRVVVKHTSRIVEAKSSCGCTVPKLRPIDSRSSEMLIYLKPAAADKFASSIFLKMEGGVERQIDILGDFAPAVKVTPSAIEIDVEGPYELMFDLSGAGFDRPVVRCLDERFQFDLISRDNFQVVGQLKLLGDPSSSEFAFATAIMFAISNEDNSGVDSVLSPVQIRRRMPRVLLPSAFTIVRGSNEPVRLLIIGGCKGILGRTGRCRIGGLFEGMIVEERDKFLRAELSATSWDKGTPDSLELEFEIELEEAGRSSWRPVGKVGVSILD